MLANGVPNHYFINRQIPEMIAISGNPALHNRTQSKKSVFHINQLLPVLLPAATLFLQM